MDIFDRNPITNLDEIVFANDATKDRILRIATKSGAMNSLLFGPAGTGKTTLCNVIAKHLVGLDYITDITSINVSNYSGKKELTDKIESLNGFGSFNELGKIVVILEELDGAQKPAQKALKDVISKFSSSVLFLATTNEIDNIIEPIIDRFDCIEIAATPAERWKQRAMLVLANEGVRFTENQAQHLLELKANGVSGRNVMRVLDDFACKVKMANS